MSFTVTSASGLSNLTGAAAASVTSVTSSPPKATALPNPMLIAKSDPTTSTPPKAISAHVVGVKSSFDAPQVPEAPEAPALDPNYGRVEVVAPGGYLYPGYMNAETTELLIGELPEPFPRSSIITRQHIATNLAAIQTYIAAQKIFFDTQRKEISAWEKVQQSLIDALKDTSRDLYRLENKIENLKQCWDQIHPKKEEDCVEFTFKDAKGKNVVQKLYSASQFQKLNQERASANQQLIPDIFIVSRYLAALQKQINSVQQGCQNTQEEIEVLKNRLKIERNKKSTLQPTLLLSKLQIKLIRAEEKWAWWARKICAFNKPPSLVPKKERVLDQELNSK